MSDSTKQSKSWRAEQRALGCVPKLIWPHAADWPKVKHLLDTLKLKRALQRKRTKEKQE